MFNHIEITWDVGSLNPFNGANWGFTALLSASGGFTMLQIPGWTRPCWDECNWGCIISDEKPIEDEEQPREWTSYIMNKATKWIRKTYYALMKKQMNILRTIWNRSFFFFKEKKKLTSLASSPSMLNSSRGFTVASFIDRNWKRRTRINAKKK